MSYINPDSLLLAALGTRRSRLELRADKRKHILAPLQQHLARRIIRAGLRAVEALERILLRPVGVSAVGLHEARVEEEEEGFSQPGGLLLAAFSGRDEGVEAQAADRCRGGAGEEGGVFRVRGQHVTTRKSHGTLSCLSR